MPAAATKTTPAKRTPAPRKVAGHTPPKATFVEPTLDDAEPEPFTVDGLKVIESHRPQNLPNAPYKHLKLTLEDGTHRYQCVDCPDFISGREEVRIHRRLVHPAMKDPNKLSPGVLQMTMGQILAAADASLTAGALVERIEAERDRYRTELTELTRKYNALTRALEKVGFTPKLEDE